MRLSWVAALALANVVPAVAASETLHKGQIVRDANAGRLGVIDKVNADGSVQIIFEGRVVTLPASTIKLDGNNVSTSLTKKDVARIN